MWANLGRLADTWAHAATLDSTGREGLRQSVVRASEADDLPDSWERRVVELGDGRTVAEIIELLFSEEIRAGAWTVDIGLWKPLFDQSVLKTIGRMAAKGYVRLVPK